MASLELNQRSGKYHIRYRFGGRSFKRSLKTSDPKAARAALARFEETISLIDRGLLELPEQADPTTFLLSSGKFAGQAPRPELLSLRDLFCKYQESLPHHAKEASTLETEEIHLRHFAKYLPVNKPAAAITTADVQEYVNQQLKRTFHGRSVSAGTVKRQIDTLRGIFNWAIKQRILQMSSPTSGLVFPKRDEKPPFRTRTEIERIIGRGGLDKDQCKELWNSLYLTTSEVRQVLEMVRQKPRYPFIYPMFAFVAFTGARRSEMLRALIDDFDLERGSDNGLRYSYAVLTGYQVASRDSTADPRHDDDAATSSSPLLGASWSFPLGPWHCLLLLLIAVAFIAAALPRGPRNARPVRRTRGANTQ